MVCHYAWKDNFCIGIVAIWLRPTNRLGFGATMAITMAGAKSHNMGHGKVAGKMRRRAMATKKAEGEKRAKEKEKHDMSARWQDAGVPQDIRRPWHVFHEDTVFKVNDPFGEFGDGHEDLRAVQKLGALRAFQELPACRQREYTAVSLQELSAFAAWSATCGLTDATERIAAWTGLDENQKAKHVSRNWHALLAKDPTWHVLIADDMRKEV